MNFMTADQGYEFLISKITESMDVHSPKKLIKINSDEKFNEPWLSVSIKRSNQKCRKLCAKARASGLSSDYERYRAYRNALNRIKYHEKCTHYDNLF